MVSGRLVRSMKSSPGNPEVVNETFDQDLTGEVDVFNYASQI